MDIILTRLLFWSAGFYFDNFLNTPRKQAKLSAWVEWPKPYTVTDGQTRECIISMLKILSLY